LRGEVFKKIRQELERDPDQRVKDVAAKLGCSPASVSVMRSRMGLIGKPRPSMEVVFSNANMKFLYDQADKRGVSMPEMLNAIITDARMEGGE
jgi:hypothetical protein